MEDIELPAAARVDPGSETTVIVRNGSRSPTVVGVAPLVVGVVAHTVVGVVPTVVGVVATEVGVVPRTVVGVVHTVVGVAPL